jgi:hypothetical protein
MKEEMKTGPAEMKATVSAIQEEMKAAVRASKEETHGNQQEGPNGDRETTEGDRTDDQLLGNKWVPAYILRAPPQHADHRNGKGLP